MTKTRLAVKSLKLINQMRKLCLHQTIVIFLFQFWFLSKKKWQLCKILFFQITPLLTNQSELKFIIISIFRLAAQLLHYITMVTVHLKSQCTNANIIPAVQLICNWSLCVTSITRLKRKINKMDSKITSSWHKIARKIKHWNDFWQVCDIKLHKK